MATRMQQRRGTAAQWTGANPILAAGEIGFETDTNKFKIGNGSSTWSSLSYYASADDLADLIDGAPDLLNTLNELAAALGDDPSFLSDHVNGTTNVHGIANTADLATQDFVTDAITNSTVDQSALAGTGIDWNAGTEQFDIDNTVVTLNGTQTLTNKTLSGADLGGSSTAQTQSNSDNSTKIATTEFVQTKIDGLINGAPGALDTLKELADAIGDDANYAASVTTALSERVSKAGDSMTGALTLSGAPSDDLHAATKGYVDSGIGAHNDDHTNVHGIADTDALATKDYAEAQVNTHNSDTTDVHGISDTSALATKTYADNSSDDAVTAHNALTANVHGINNTAELATQTQVATAVTNHNGETENVHGITDTASLVTLTILGDHNSDTTNVHGILDTSALATTADISDHSSVTENVHGIANTADLVLTDDVRLSDTRTPTDNTVSTEKIVNSAVTADKLAGDSVTESKVADGAITSGKIANGTIVNADINASAAIDWTKLAVSSTVSETELGYLDGVTSAIQTQIDSVPGLIATAKSEAIADATAQVNAVIASAPTALNTLDELAAALGDDANYAATVTTALEGKVPSATTISQKTDSYTLSSISEKDTLIEMGKATAQTVTIPTNASVAFPVGTSLDILQTGAGQVTIAGAAGVTVNGTPGLKLRTQWSSATLFKRAENTWVVMGDLSA
jgi:hypothetical protein